MTMLSVVGEVVLDVEAKLFIFGGHFDEVAKPFLKFLRAATGAVYVGDAYSLVALRQFLKVGPGRGFGFNAFQDVIRYFENVV